MALEKNEANLLLDFYENLLTERAREILNLYYREDLSISEISENLAISRAAVSDQLQRSDRMLVDYEEKMQNLAHYRQRMAIYEKYGSQEAFQDIIRELKETE